VPARLTLHPPQRASLVVLLSASRPSAVIGRDPSCDVVVDDVRVSKRHAEVLPDGDAWVIEDLGSKNGTSVDGKPARQTLKEGCWVSVGGVLGRFQYLTEHALAELEADRRQRLDTSVAIRRSFEAEADPRIILERLLRSALELTGSMRGFVLVAGDEGGYRAEVAVGLGPAEIRGSGFSGSMGVVERVASTARPVVTHDARLDPLLGKRPSVVAGGIRAVACVPLLHARRIFGILYVDGPRPDTPLTELDMEILETLAEHASLVLATRDAGARLRALLQPRQAPPDDELQAALAQRLAALPRPSPPTDTGPVPKPR
jgi:hypothetical protein